MCYNDRHPKPPTPKLPTPPALPTPPPEAAAADGTIPTADGQTVDGVVVSGDAAAVVAAVVEPEPEVPKGPPPPPPPFDYFLDLPAEGAEVPFVRNYVPPPPEPEPVAIREDGQPTCNFISSFASHHVGVASDCPPPVVETPPASEAAPAPAPTAEAPTTESAPAEPKVESAPAESAPPAEAPPADAPAAS